MRWRRMGDYDVIWGHNLNSSKGLYKGLYRRLLQGILREILEV